MALTPEELRESFKAPAPAPQTQSSPSEPEPTAQEPRQRRADRTRGKSRPRQQASRRSGDQNLPQSEEAEKGVLGSILNDPRIVPIVLRRISTEHFTDHVRRAVFSALCEYYLQEPSFDLSTFTTHLAETGQLDPLGGPAYITGLYTFVPTAANIDYYVGILLEKHLLRAAISGARELEKAALEGQEPSEIVALAAAQAEKIRLLSSPSLSGVENFDFDALLAFDPAADPTQLLGQRWQCRGFTALWAGPAGAGKSTLQMQLAIYWGCGMACFGIKPARPLKSLILQAENDQGDVSEQLCGVMRGIGKCGDIKEINFSLNGASHVRANVLVKRVVGSTGDSFLPILDTLIEQNSPDLVWIDPLFAFAGCDLLDAEKIGRFLREGITPIAVNRGISLHVIHHVGKPSRDNQDKSAWSDLDFQYLGFGSSEVQNSFRAVNVMLPVSGQENVFRLILSKRGTRAGARSPDQELTTNIYLAQAKEGICWLQIDKPQQEEVAQSRANAGQFQAKFRAEVILEHMSIFNGQKTEALQKLVSTETGMSKPTFYRLFAKLKEDHKVGSGIGGWVAIRSEN